MAGVKGRSKESEGTQTSLFLDLCEMAFFSEYIMNLPCSINAAK
jgi:hypothetical protein